MFLKYKIFYTVFVSNAKGRYYLISCCNEQQYPSVELIYEVCLKTIFHVMY